MSKIAIDREDFAEVMGQLALLSGMLEVEARRCSEMADKMEKEYDFEHELTLYWIRATQEEKSKAKVVDNLLRRLNNAEREADEV